MKSLFSRPAVIVAGLVSVLTVGLVSAPAVADTDGGYVALGDSYSSGVGTAATDPASGSCRRSPLGYPQRWADAHPDDAFTNVSCSAAEIDDVSEQAEVINDETKFVTLTVGGNDDGFALIMNICIRGNNFLCRAATRAASAYSKLILRRELKKLYAQLRSQAPNAQILVLSYPNLLAATGSCQSLSISKSKRKSINRSIDTLDTVIRKTAKKNDLGFLDLRQVFSGHEACSPEPWINGYDDDNADEAFHPNAAGHAAIHEAITKWRRQ